MKCSRKFGSILKVHLTGAMQGFKSQNAIVECEDLDTAMAIVDELNEAVFFGRRSSVTYAVPTDDVLSFFEYTKKSNQKVFKKKKLE